MTASLNNVAIQMFHDSFVNEYAATQTLMGTTQDIRRAIGNAYTWPLLGNAVMIDRGSFQSLIPASDISHTPVTTTYQNKVLNLPTDIFEQAEVNVSEQAAIVNKLTQASGRQIDQFKIDAMDASAGITILDGGTNLTVAKLKEAKQLMDEDNVPEDTRYLALSASAQSALLDETEVVSNLYNNDRVLVNGAIKQYLGFKFFVIGNRVEGGLPKTLDIRTNFVWHQNAMGYVESLSPTANAEWSVERQSWLAVMRLRAGASALLDEGIIKIACDETA